MILALAATLAVFLWAHGQALVSPYVINDDVRQQVAWMQRWEDPALYPNDMLTDFARHYVSYGVRGIYAVASTIMPPVWCTKVLAGVLYVSLGGLVFACGRNLAGLAGGWGLLCAYWIIPFFLHNISGGLARAFAGPSLALFCLGWMHRRTGWMAWALLVEAVFIPYMFVLSGLAVGLAWLGARFRVMPAPPMPRLWWHWLILALGAALVWQFNHALDAAGYGPLVDRALMQHRPEFTAEGRLRIFPVPSVLQEAVLSPLEALLPTAKLGPAGGVAVTVCLGLLLVWGGVRAPWRALRPHWPLFASLAAASLLLYGLARLFLMQLFVPTRYLEYSVALLHCLVLGMCLTALLMRWQRPRLALLLIGGFALAGALRLEGQGLYDYSRDAALYAAVQRTPKDAMLAGHPFLMDNVLLFGKRNVLVSFELAHPWCVGLWNRLAPRLDAFFTAYYAEDPDTVRAFAQAQGVDWMVVDDRHFAPEFLHWPVRQAPVCEVGGFGPLRGLCEAVTNATTSLAAPLPDVYPVTPPFFAPYRRDIQQRAQAARTFALLDASEFPGIAVDEHIRLVPLKAGQRLASEPQ